MREMPRLRPNLPSHWNWAGVRDLPFHGRNVTWFFARTPELRVWSNVNIECSAQPELGLVGNIQHRTITRAVRLQDPKRGRYSVRIYDRLNRAWS